MYELNLRSTTKNYKVFKNPTPLHSALCCRDDARRPVAVAEVYVCVSASVCTCKYNLPVEVSAHAHGLTDPMTISSANNPYYYNIYAAYRLHRSADAVITIKCQSRATRQERERMRSDTVIYIYYGWHDTWAQTWKYNYMFWRALKLSWLEITASVLAVML